MYEKNDDDKQTYWKAEGCLHTCKKRVIVVIYHRKFFWIFRKILGWEREINTAPKPSPEVAPSQFKAFTHFLSRLSHFFVDFHDLRTFSTILDGGSTILDGGSTTLDGSSTIFCRFSPFFIDFHDLRTFVAIYILSRFTHFFRKFFWPK